MKRDDTLMAMDGDELGFVDTGGSLMKLPAKQYDDFTGELLALKSTFACFDTFLCGLCTDIFDDGWPVLKF